MAAKGADRAVLTSALQGDVANCARRRRSGRDRLRVLRVDLGVGAVIRAAPGTRMLPLFTLICWLEVVPACSISAAVWPVPLFTAANREGQLLSEVPETVRHQGRWTVISWVLVPVLVSMTAAPDARGAQRVRRIDRRAAAAEGQLTSITPPTVMVWKGARLNERVVVVMQTGGRSTGCHRTSRLPLRMRFWVETAEIEAYETRARGRTTAPGE